MGGSESWIWVAVVGGVFLGLGLAVYSMLRGSVRASTLRNVQRQFAGRDVVAVTSKAYFHGFDRSWDNQWRGYGVLILVGEILHFRLWQRDLDLTIFMDRVEKIELRPELGRGRCGRRAFRVTYRGLDDQPRVATWFVRRPHRWVNLIRMHSERDLHHAKAEEKRLSPHEDPRGGSLPLG